MKQDLHYCFRMLFKSPGVVIAAILSLGLGIGLNLTVFGVFEAMFFRGVTAANPDRTFHLWIGGSNRASYPNFDDIRRSKAVPDVFAYSIASFTLGDGDSRQRIYGQVTAGDYFESLGAKPLIGRLFSAEEKAPEQAAQVVILSYGYWQQKFGGSTSALGQTLRLNAQPFTVIGVLPANYRSMHGFALEPPFYVPYSKATDANYRDRSGHPLELAIRTAPGQTAKQASDALLPVLKDLERTYPTENARLSELRIFGTGLADSLQGQGGMRNALIFFAVLSVLTGLILLIACANIASLLLARAVNRKREIAVRLALGASRRRLIGLFLTEGALLGLAGLFSATFFYVWSLQLLEHLDLPVEVPWVIRPELNWRMALYSVIAGLGTALICSLGPALEATRANMLGGLKDDSAATTARVFSFRNGLVIGQVAVSLLLLVTSLLFVRSLRDVQNADPGFNVANQLRAEIQFDDPGSAGRSKSVDDEVVERLQKIPGVRSVSLSAFAPLSGKQWFTGVNINQDPNHQVVIQANAIGPNYFQTMGVRQLAGREFTKTDTASSQQVAVVNEAFAIQHLGGRNPIGVLLSMPKGRSNQEVFEIVGVVATTKHASLGEAPTPVLYRPLTQEGLPFPPDIQIRTEGPASEAAATVRAAIREIAPKATVNVETMQRVVEYSTYVNKLGAALLGALGVLGLVLASIGLYGVLAYGVSRRAREIGIRIALGASSSQVLRVVLRQSMLLVTIGVAIGLGLATVATRPLAAFLSSRVSVTDPVSLGLVVVVLAITGIAAAVVPARRAIGIDPAIALRYE